MRWGCGTGVVAVTRRLQLWTLYYLIAPLETHLPAFPPLSKNLGCDRGPDAHRGGETVQNLPIHGSSLFDVTYITRSLQSYVLIKASFWSISQLQCTYFIF